MGVVEKAISWMESTARDNSHGYDQDYRWGQKGDYDCSAAVITAWEKAGVPVKTKGATYTGDMKKVFLKCGFRDMTNKVNLATGKGLIRGDVLLNEGHHTAMYCGNGQEVEASINEKGGAHGGTPGDQTGREFLIRAYRNYPWNVILRYSDDASGQSTDSGVTGIIRYGSYGDSVRECQELLRKYGFTLDIDGEFGPVTEKAVKDFQKSVGLEVDGEVGPNTWAALRKKDKERIKCIAEEVIRGYWGNGDERRQRLHAAGYDYDTVQKCVNKLLK